jgi:hypothetical protein
VTPILSVVVLREAHGVFEPNSPFRGAVQTIPFAERGGEETMSIKNPVAVATGALPQLEPLRYVLTDALEVAYFEAGPSDGEVTLLHRSSKKGHLLLGSVQFVYSRKRLYWGHPAHVADSIHQHPLGWRTADVRPRLEVSAHVQGYELAQPAIPRRLAVKGSSRCDFACIGPSYPIVVSRDGIRTTTEQRVLLSLLEE